MRASYGSLLFAAWLLAGCGQDPAPSQPVSDVPVVTDQPAVVDRNETVDVFDAAVPEDIASPPDITALDAPDALDASAPADASRDVTPATDTWSGSTDILGTLAGTCGTLRGMLHSPTPSYIENTLTFTASERYARDQLSPAGQRLFDTPNAGGSSAESEVMSLEVLHYCEGAELLRTETEIRYQAPDDSGANSITDILVTVGGERVGVSVTRVYRPAPMVVTEAIAREIILGKLQGINRSSVRVLPKDRWVKQVLHVFVADPAVMPLVRSAWMSIDLATRADTVVLVTLTRGGGFVYCNPDPPLGSECPPIM
jgi:hypothetical protein